MKYDVEEFNSIIASFIKSRAEETNRRIKHFMVENDLCENDIINNMMVKNYTKEHSEEIFYDGKFIFGSKIVLEDGRFKVRFLDEEFGDSLYL